MKAWTKMIQSMIHIILRQETLMWEDLQFLKSSYSSLKAIEMCFLWIPQPKQDYVTNQVTIAVRFSEPKFVQ